MLARARFLFLTASPIERAALAGVVTLWLLVLVIGLAVAGVASYEVFFAERTLSPDKQAILDPRSFTPLVHIGIEPLLVATPATQPRATPATQPRAAPTRRPPVIMVIPTPITPRTK
jgi:hypothetical protein